jgi:hypothetical protein
MVGVKELQVLGMRNGGRFEDVGGVGYKVVEGAAEVGCAGENSGGEGFAD